jgi:hypothetical protein
VVVLRKSSGGTDNGDKVRNDLMRSVSIGANSNVGTNNEGKDGKEEDWFLCGNSKFKCECWKHQC